MMRTLALLLPAFLCLASPARPEDRIPSPDLTLLFAKAIP